MPDPLPDATLVGDLLARDRRDRTTALHVAASDRTLSYRDLCTTAYKAGNVLSHHGVRAGDVVDVEPRPAPEPVLTFLGATLLGAVTAFRADPGADDVTDARAVVVHAEREDEFDLPPGARLLAFGGEPDRPTTTHWEGEVWSENPAFPPTDHDPDDPVLAVGDGGYSHARLLRGANGLRADRVAGRDRPIRDPLSDPGAVVALLAALLDGRAANLAGRSVDPATERDGG
ncbi:acetyl-CoA synthetase [Halorarum halobium]|uniref:acetyl-CoA synthetase n=1 Tax=Halorarum halobium TaxID=3075121 RepID=UPI0028A73F97|nr:acetyl-CoA synthetase [Halobaculum sp. XH14]